MPDVCSPDGTVPLTIRVLHLADVHLGASMSSFGEIAGERREAVREAFRALPGAARHEEVDAVVVAGDLFDGHQPHGEDLAVAADVFARLIEDGRPVVAVPGNHDSPTIHPHPWREPLGGARVLMAPSFERVTIETAGGPLHVYGAAYDRAREPDPLATYAPSGEPGVHLVLLHGSAEFSPHWAIGGNALRLPLDALAELDCDYIALGDYHTYRPPERFGGESSIPAAYSGSFAALDLTETGPRGYVIAELEPGRPPRVEHRPSDVPPVHEAGDVDVSEATDHDEVVRRVLDRVGEGVLPLVRLVGVPDFPLDAGAVADRLRERFGFARVEDASAYYESERLDEIAGDDTVAGHVVRLGRQRIDDAEGDEERAIAERALRLALQGLEVS